MNARLILMTKRWSERSGWKLAALALITVANLGAAEWEKLPPLPEPSGGSACGSDHGRVVVAGGTNWVAGEKKWLTAVHEFDPETQKWKTRPELNSPFAYGVAGTAKKGMVPGEAFLFGGGYTGTAGFDKMILIEGHGHRVVLKGLTAERATVLAAGGVIDDKLIFSGGTSDPGNLAGFRRSTFTVNSKAEIEVLPDYPGKGFGIAASATLDDSLFVFGGANWAGTNQDVVNSSEAYAFSSSSKTWRKLQNFPYAVRGVTAIPLDGNHLYLAGGFKNDVDGFTDESFIYDTANDTYTPAAPLPYKAMVGLVNCSGFIYCLGGEDKQKSRTDACFRIAIAELLNPP